MTVGWGRQSDPGFGASLDNTSVKAKTINLIASVRTVMRSTVASSFICFALRQLTHDSSNCSTSDSDQHDHYRLRTDPRLISQSLGFESKTRRSRSPWTPYPRRVVSRRILGGDSGWVGSTSVRTECGAVLSTAGLRLYLPFANGRTPEDQAGSTAGGLLAV
jgi:hypothetical protein